MVLVFYLFFILKTQYLMIEMEDVFNFQWLIQLMFICCIILDQLYLLPQLIRIFFISPLLQYFDYYLMNELMLQLKQQIYNHNSNILDQVQYPKYLYNKYIIIFFVISIIFIFILFLQTILFNLLIYNSFSLIKYPLCSRFKSI